MNTISQTGGLTYDGATSVRREIPVVQSFPSVKGRVKSASISTYLRASAAGTHAITVVLFKTFNSPGSWNNSGTRLYQTPSNTNVYLTGSTVDAYCQNVLARKTLDITFAGTGNRQFDITFDEADLTDYGRNGANWAGDVMVAVYKSSYSPDTYWGNATQTVITIGYNSGVVKYGVGGQWVDCEMYYGAGGQWVQVQPYYGTGGAWKEAGG